MAKKKKRKNNSQKPQKALKKGARMNAAKEWLPTFTGRKIISAYRKKYNVNTTCAARELHELGYIDTGQMEQVIKQEEKRLVDQEQRKAEKKAAAEESFFDFQDDEFAFIAGYTAGGAPYGLRWDEIPEEEWELHGYEKASIDDDLELFSSDLKQLIDELSQINLDDFSLNLDDLPLINLDDLSLTNYEKQYDDDLPF